jgi:hypothetical protein
VRERIEVFDGTVEKLISDAVLRASPPATRSSHRRRSLTSELVESP